MFNTDNRNPLPSTLTRRIVGLALCVASLASACSSDDPTGPVQGMGGFTTGGTAPGTGASGGANPGGAGPGSGGFGTGSGPVGSGGFVGSGGAGGGAGGGPGSGGATGGTSGSGGAGVTGGAGGSSGGGTGLGPLTRADGFVDAAPPLGAKLPAAAPGTWTWVDVPEMKCRDGSASGLYVRYGTSKNFFIYLEGGGVCLNDFFCGINPKNVNQTQNAESILAGAAGMPAVKQAPGNDGIFKNDPRNPVKDWNAVYVPYCTGDIWGGNKPNATFPPGFEGLGGNTTGQHQFVGFNNTSIVLGRVAATFPDGDKSLITGSSAGGIGALLNAHRLADLMRKQGSRSRGFVVSDSAVPFKDDFLATCTQKIWRDLWGLNPSFPSDCPDCFPASGGSLATGLASYFTKKFPNENEVLGGLISSADDEIIKFFYGAGLPGCTPTTYTAGTTYPNALKDFRDNIVGKKRFGTYFLPGTLHMHLWRARFYETNGGTMTIADWLGKILNNEPVHVGL